MAAMIVSSLAWGQDFRVETDVFIGKEKEPIAQYLTVFESNTIYDFVLTGPQQATIFDVTRGRFLLLDAERQVKTELTTRDVEAFHQRLRERGLERDEAIFQAQYQYHYDEPEQWHVLTGDVVEYRARGVTPKFPDAAERYRAFADWYARLNAMRPGNPPPYARLELNRLLAEKQLIPESIERSLTTGRIAPRRLEARTEHHINWRLSAPDHKRIQRVGDQLANFRQVTAAEFFQDGALAKSE
jgi:hypothetical protein